MKKSILASVLTALLLVSGCSNSNSSASDTPTKKSNTVATSSQPSKQSSTPIKTAVTTTTKKEPKTETAVTNQKKTTVTTKKKVTVPSNLVSAIVSKETDGDTIHVTLNGNDETIRMLLIDTPEEKDPRKPVEPYAYKAADYAQSVLPVGKHIYLQLGKKGYERDKYDRLLAYVYITPKDMYNEDVIKKGYARVAYIYPPNTDHLSDLQNAQSYAKSHNLGIWSLTGYVTANGYSLTKSCDYAKNNGYSTRGCGTTTPTRPKPKPTTPTSPTSDVGSSLSVSHGQYASVTIKTTPGAQGTIEVYYNSGPSTAQGLYPKSADGSGLITWTWKVGTRTAPGTYDVDITVNGKTITKYLTVY